MRRNKYKTTQSPFNWMNDKDMIDTLIVDAMLAGGIDFFCSLPCNMLAGIIRIIDGRDDLDHIPITREEEGVGIAAGAHLGGKNPAILMQNSGLGNSINALLSLTTLYRMPLLLLMSHRGGRYERIVAQMPMGDAIIPLLETLGIDYCFIFRRSDIASIRVFAKDAILKSEIKAVLLQKELWDEES